MFLGCITPHDGVRRKHGRKVVLRNLEKEEKVKKKNRYTYVIRKNKITNEV